MIVIMYSISWQDSNFGNMSASWNPYKVFDDSGGNNWAITLYKKQLHHTMTSNQYKYLEQGTVILQWYVTLLVC